MHVIQLLHHLFCFPGGGRFSTYPRILFVYVPQDLQEMQEKQEKTTKFERSLKKCLFLFAYIKKLLYLCTVKQKQRENESKHTTHKRGKQRTRIRCILPSFNTQTGFGIRRPANHRQTIHCEPWGNNYCRV